MIRVFLGFAGGYVEEVLLEDVYVTGRGLHGLTFDGRVVNLSDAVELQEICFAEASL